ncbi:MAG: homoserine dehydrogenase [Candidatus Goldiibacteriota bacterium HGW-Goldbacteria-1]|nr:MAG: homoserine dehydrogenase [Candidatus Goldiibacteriota bacterium HGW-Goldbacteria-1]
MAKDTVKAGLIGFGTIGTGVVKLFKNSAELINTKSGIKVELVKVCDLDIKRDRGVKLAPGMLTTNVNDIIENPEIDIVIELMGGYKPALDFVTRALKNGKRVVTANKALISKYWEEISAASKEGDAEIMAEASVGGGIPILRGLDKGLAANKIEKIMAILNGTCNYILTKMTVDKMSFDAALKEAQQKGFAEADPTLDIEGFDTMHKITVLSRMSFGKGIKHEDIHVEGIKGIDYTDIKYGQEMGYVMKLLAIAQRCKEGINVRVHPVFVPQMNLLASVNYEYNAIFVRGDAVGDTLFYGKGAGELPTASAVLSDVIYIARNMASGAKHVRYASKAKTEKIKVLPIGETVNRYYIRFNVVDKAGVMGEITGVLGKHNISIASVIQKEQNQHSKVPVVFMTYAAKEADVIKALKAIDKLAIVKEKTVMYRVIE